MSKRFRETKDLFKETGIKLNNCNVRRMIHASDIKRKRDRKTLCQFKQAHLDGAYKRLKRRINE